MATRRGTAGILCPISCLPGSVGTGDFGPAAERFIAWLQAAGQRYWQILPLTIPDSVGSPYASVSSMAGNWMFISLERLRADGLLPLKLRLPRLRPSAAINLRDAWPAKRKVFRMAFAYFRQSGTARQRHDFRRFCRQQRNWLIDAAWFLALKDHYRQRPWWFWAKPDQTRTTARLDRPRLRTRYEYHLFLQWVFDRQWQRIRRIAHSSGIRIIGDLPFSPPLDSAEVWSRPDIFLLNRAHRPKAVSGVPPDAFAGRGQRWGHPVYRWRTHRAANYQWWLERVRVTLRQFDIVRLDHFRGLAATWHIPARQTDPSRGRWVATPGREILRRIKRAHPALPMIAEDLGHFSPNAEHLRHEFGFDGMRVLLFGWSGLPKNIHHPDHLQPDMYYYTSTHDTNTVLGWWRGQAKWYERMHVRNYLGPVRDLAWQFIETVYRSRADVAMVAIQDVLRLGSSAQLNRPGTRRGNWRWRFRAKDLTDQTAQRLYGLAKRYGRSR